MPDLLTFVFENVTKFILGQKPISEFEAFSAELDKRGIKDVQKIYEAALRPAGQSARKVGLTADTRRQCDFTAGGGRFRPPPRFGPSKERS